MPTVTVKDTIGAEHGTVELDEATFGIEPNVPVMHQVVTAQLAARRSGTQSTKTRAEVRGGGAKPWKQKGTGRARQGSIRSPQWKGGGVALGPKPRSYAQRTPKKMIKLALRSALSDRAAEGQIVVIDQWGFDTPSTKSAAAALGALGLAGRIVVVVRGDDADTVKSFRNLPSVHLLQPGELNAYDILCSDYVVFTRDTLPGAPAEKAEKAPVATTAEAPKPAEAVKATKAPKAAKAPVEAPSPAAEPDSGDDVTTESGGDPDMSDLPNRPKNTGEATKPVDPAERVKPAGDKANPRFEAARVKAEKEAGLRAKTQGAETTDEADAEAPADEPAPSGFSFNTTVEPDEAGQ
jgi:large subunit ribosomal protein L4